MKKLLLLFTTIIVFVSCYDMDKQEIKSTGDSPYNVFVENVRGHDYVVFWTHFSYGTSISAIHSESCKCKTIKPE